MTEKEAYAWLGWDLNGILTLPVADFQNNDWETYRCDGCHLAGIARGSHPVCPNCQQLMELSAPRGPNVNRGYAKLTEVKPEK